MKKYASFVTICFDQDQIWVKLLSNLKDLRDFQASDRPAPVYGGDRCTLREFALQFVQADVVHRLRLSACRAIGRPCIWAKSRPS